MTQTHTQTERDRQTDTQRGWWQMLRLVIKSRCGAACKLRCHRNTLGNNASRRSCGRAGNRQLSRLVANLVALARNREIADSGGAYAHSVFGLPSRFCEIFLRFTEWLGSRVVSVLDSGAERPGFKSQPRRCRVTVLGKLFTPIVPLFTKQRNW